MLHERAMSREEKGPINQDSNEFVHGIFHLGLRGWQGEVEGGSFCVGGGFGKVRMVKGWDCLAPSTAPGVP